ncbi:hypothetical protein M942_05355 [Enterobacter ludwigii]|nr:hypothetical protein M942_05355 [Enterobacter ludwigii]
MLMLLMVRYKKAKNPRATHRDEAGLTEAISFLLTRLVLLE